MLLDSISYKMRGKDSTEYCQLRSSFSNFIRIPEDKREALSIIERCLAGDVTAYYDKQDGVELNIENAVLQFSSGKQIILTDGSCKRNISDEIICIRYVGAPSKFIRSFKCYDARELNIPEDEEDIKDNAVDFTTYSLSGKVSLAIWQKIRFTYNLMKVGVMKDVAPYEKVQIKELNGFTLREAQIAYLLVAEAVYARSICDNVIMLINIDNVELQQRIVGVLQQMDIDIYY